jgi:hypothetical protein
LQPSTRQKTAEQTSADGELTSWNGSGSRRGKIIPTAAVSRDEASMMNELKNSINVACGRLATTSPAKLDRSQKADEQQTKYWRRSITWRDVWRSCRCAQQQPKQTSASHLETQPVARTHQTRPPQIFVWPTYRRSAAGAGATAQPARRARLLQRLVSGLRQLFYLSARDVDALVSKLCDELKSATESLDISSQGSDHAILKIEPGLEPRDVGLIDLRVLSDIDLCLTSGFAHGF